MSSWLYRYNTNSLRFPKISGKLSACANSGYQTLSFPESQGTRSLPHYLGSPSYKLRAASLKIKELGGSVHTVSLHTQPGQPGDLVVLSQQF